jgi:hypothetical protein
MNDQLIGWFVSVQQAPHQWMDKQNAQPGNPNEKSAKDQCQLSSRQLVEPTADPFQHRFPAPLHPTLGRAVVAGPRAGRLAPNPRLMLSEGRGEAHKIFRDLDVWFKWRT